MRTLEPLSLFLKSIQILVTLCIGVALFGFFSFYTQVGTVAFLNTVSFFTPYKFTFSHVEGCLADHKLIFKDLHILGFKDQIVAKDVAINWQWDAPYPIKISVHQAHLVQLPVQKLDLQLDGTLASHKIRAKGTYQNAPFSVIVDGKMNDTVWHGTSVLTLWGKYPINGTIAIQRSAPHALQAHAHTAINEVHTLTPLIPELDKVRGHLKVDLQVKGTLSKPEWTGNIKLINGKIITTNLGSQPSIAHLNIQFLPAAKIHLEGKGKWGDGNFSVDGAGSYNDPLVPLRINFSGKNLLVSNTPEYTFVADSQLQFIHNNNTSMLTGKLFVSKGKIINLNTANRINPSDDVVIVSSKNTNIPQKQHGLNSSLATNIEVALGNNVTYQGFGLTANLRGNLRISQAPGQAPKANGKLSLISGKYKAYGKSFDIQEGDVLYSNDALGDPTLNIRAQRVIQPSSTFSLSKNDQPITAGIRLTGRAKNPHLGFYSNPAMTDADVISYLIVGRPQSKVNEAQAELLFDAVSQLAILIGNKRGDVQFNLAEKLKLDQLGFAKRSSFMSSNKVAGPTKNPLEDTVLVLGKQLSDKLYLNYSVGIMDSANNIGLRYLLGKNITIEAATGPEGSSADIVFSFENG